MSDSNIWAEPSEKLFCKVIERRFELVSVETDEGQNEVEYIVIEVTNLLRPDQEWNPTFRFKKSMHTKSKWSIWKKAFKKIGHVIKGDDDIVGHYFQFSIEDLDFGGDFVATNYPRPVAHYSSEAECIAAGNEIVATAQLGMDEWQKALVGVLDGKTFEGSLQAIVTNETLKGDGERMAKLISDKMPILTVMAGGWLTQGEDGVYHKVG